MANNIVSISILFNGKILVLPINPENISIQRTATNENIDIIGLGKATRKGEPGLVNFTIESFFPGPNSYFYKGNRPKACIEFINEIWETENLNNNVAKIIITGIPIPINMYFVIESFNYDHNAGDEEDITYKLQIKKYIPYGAKIIGEATTSTVTRVTSPNVQITNNDNSDSYSGLTYTVKSGDSLSSITKRSTGNSSNWKALYELNKSIIGDNPNLIKPGQVLRLPINWELPKTVVTVKPVSQTTTSTTTRRDQLSQSLQANHSSLHNKLFTHNANSGNGGGAW